MLQNHNFLRKEKKEEVVWAIGKTLLGEEEREGTPTKLR